MHALKMSELQFSLWHAWSGNKWGWGMMKAFRTVPVILDIVEDMKELCPDAWLINFTNPSGMITGNSDQIWKMGKMHWFYVMYP